MKWQKRGWVAIGAFLLIGIGLFLIIGIGTPLMENTDPHQEDMLTWIDTGEGYLHLGTYPENRPPETSELVVVLHGDMDNPQYHYLMANRLASLSPNTVAVGILRPGYTDGEGNISNGARGLAVGDNYSAKAIGMIAEAIRKLKATYHPRRTLVIGHSGGAAITGDLIGLYPGLVNTAILVSCPCDLEDWRSHMKAQHPLNPVWYFGKSGISPIDVADRITGTRVILLVGTEDHVTPRRLSRAYYDQLVSENKYARLIELPGLDHNMLLDKAVTDTIRTYLDHAPEVSIQGTWKLLEGTVVDHGDTTITDYTGNTSFIKIINNSHFAFLQHDMNKGQDSSASFVAGGGRYTLTGNRYTEQLEYCSAREWEGSDFDFTVEIRHDTLIQTGMEKVETAGVDRLNREKYVRLR